MAFRGSPLWLIMQYKRIAEANEEALKQLEAAHNRYKDDVMVLTLSLCNRVIAYLAHRLVHIFS